MKDNISERIDNAIEDIEKMKTMFRQKYGEESILDKEIGEVLKISKAEHEKLEQYRSIGTVEECREAVEKHRKKKVIGRYKTTYIWDAGYCPVCNCGITARWDFCQNCGQHLSWECDTE